MLRSSNLIGSPIAVRVTHIVRSIYQALDFLSPVSDLLIRLWVANVFFLSGMTKIQTFDSTIQLFTYEYQVPLLSPVVAATLSTAVELGCSVLLALGLAGRLNALALFVLNIVAVISYPGLGAGGLRDHQLWGMLLLVPLLHGPGKLSLDYLIGKVYRHVGMKGVALPGHGA